MNIKRGFTLIELVVCMILLGISAISVVSFIGMGAEFFGDTVARVELASYTRNVMLRIQRQISMSIPYQINVKSNKYLEFVQPIGTYRIIKASPSEIVLSVSQKQVNDIFHSKDSCPLLVGNTYEQKLAIIDSNKYLKQIKIKKIEDFYESKGLVIVTLDGTPSVFNSSISNANRAYIIDSCSYRRYYVESNNLYYDCGTYVPDTDGSFVNNSLVCGSSLNSDRYLVQGMMFNMVKQSNSYVSLNASNQNSILIGLLTTSKGQSMSVSQMMEVGNAP